MEDFNIFDIIVIALVLVLGLKGLLKGFIKELFGLIGIVGGVFVASRMAKDVGEIVGGLFAIDNENTVLLVGFIAGLILFWIIAYILGSIIEKVFELSGLGVVDSILGFVFGAGKIFLLFSIIAYALSGVEFINKKLEPQMKDSIMFPLLVDTGKFIIKLDSGKLEQDVKTKVNETIEEISKEELEKKANELKKQLQESVNTK